MDQGANFTVDALAYRQQEVDGAPAICGRNADRVPVTSRAAAFWTDCNRLISGIQCFRDAEEQSVAVV